MKKNNESKESKSECLSPIRVSEETQKKLQNLCEKSGKTSSAVIRDLIDNGEVRSIYNGREIIKTVAGYHNKLNAYSLKMASDIKEIKNDINQLMTVEPIRNNEICSIYLQKANLTLDMLQREYDNKLIICKRVFKKVDSDYGNF